MQIVWSTLLLLAVLFFNNNSPTTSIVASSSVSRQLTKCKDPSVERLNDILLAGIMDHFSLFLDARIDYFPYWHLKKYAHLIVNATSELPRDVQINGVELCSRINSTAWDLEQNEHSTCPYVFATFKRADRYPHEISYAVCNKCSSCLFVNETLRDPRCAPDYILRPVLVRSNAGCTVSGHSIWMFRFERVPFSCSCKTFAIYNRRK